MSQEPANPNKKEAEKKAADDLKKKINKIIERVSHPIVVGIFIVFIFVFVSWEFYKMRTDVEFKSSNNALFSLIELIDQKTIDFRFQQRGEKAPKNKVAVLAVDDRSLQSIGRWPWGRDKTAELIDEVMKHGAKGIGFDMVFSEEQIDTSLETLERIESNAGKIPLNIKTLFDKEKGMARPDKKFGDVVNKWRDKLIMGAFYEDADAAFYPYQDMCYQEAFKRLDAYKVVENEEAPPIIFDDTAAFDRIDFAGILTPVFEDIEKKTTEKLLKEKYHKTTYKELEHQEKIDLKLEQEKALQLYCARWLITEGDQPDEYLSTYKEYWKELFKDMPEFSSLPFEESVRQFQASFEDHPIMEKGKWTVNVKALRDNTAHTALFNAEPDSDGTIRRSPVIYRSGSSYIPSLAMQTFLISTGLQMHINIERVPANLIEEIKEKLFIFFATKLKWKIDKLMPIPRKVVKSIKIVNPEKEDETYEVPVDSRGRIKINYAGPQQMFPYMSAADMFTDRSTVQISQRLWDPELKMWKSETKMVDKSEFIKDTTFIIGATAIGVFDLRVTPFEKIYPGVETHVNIVDNLMSRDFLKIHHNEGLYMLLTMFFGGLLLSAGLANAGAVLGLIITTLLLGFLFFIDKFYFFKNGYLVTLALPAGQIIFLYTGLTFYKYLTEERKKKQLRSTFSKYVSPAIVDEILADPSNLELGGRKQRMTVFFSDVRGFTTFSEKLDPQVLSKVLNDYLTPMTEIVFANKGTLDKYMGDAIMAFFGAPITMPDHAKHAARCALQNLERLWTLQKEFKEQGLPVIDIGIGLNTGEMSVGNMGSEIVRNYTVMGDAVNLGSRLEGITKEYGVRIIISETTYADIKDSFTCREVDWVRVKGKNQPIRIYELICEGKASAEMEQVLKHFAEGFDFYHKQQWDDALVCFNKALAVKPDDPPSKLYVERCEDYKQDPPPENWDGVHVMKTK